MLAYKEHLSLMARYNAVMNEKLIATVTPVPEADLLASRGAFFGSVLGTMNHLVVADILWLNRMRPCPFGEILAPLDALPKPTQLTDMPYPTLAAYVPVRSQLDALLVDFIASLDDDTIAGPLAYRNTQGQPFTRTLGLVLSHVFNHQTHHRGQITTLLSQMGLDIGITDLAPLVPEIL